MLSKWWWSLLFFSLDSMWVYPCSCHIKVERLKPLGVSFTFRFVERGSPCPCRWTVYLRLTSTVLWANFLSLLLISQVCITASRFLCVSQDPTGTADAFIIGNISPTQGVENLSNFKFLFINLACRFLEAASPPAQAGLQLCAPASSSQVLGLLAPSMSSMNTWCTGPERALYEYMVSSSCAFVSYSRECYFWCSCK